MGWVAVSCVGSGGELWVLGGPAPQAQGQAGFPLFWEEVIWEEGASGQAEEQLQAGRPGPGGLFGGGGQPAGTCEEGEAGRSRPPTAEESTCAF